VLLVSSPPPSPTPGAITTRGAASPAVAAIAVLAALSLAACGDDPRSSIREPAPGTATAIPLARTPAAVTRLCAGSASGRTRSCPSLFPAAPRSRGTDSLRLTRERTEVYLFTFNVLGFEGDDSGHVLLGHQHRPLVIHGRVGQSWPRRREETPDDELRLPARVDSPRAQELIVIGRVAIGDSEGLELRAPPYPSGGVHGGHVLVLWNRSDGGYVVSLHLTDHRRPSSYSEKERLRAAVRIARSYRSYPPG
jgi:hypothetical protein